MAVLKKSDLQYEDKSYKNYWSTQFGYDYTANKNVQDKIHAVVLADIEMGIEGMAGEKSLVPPPGVHRVGNLDITITVSDKDAYCARYPQVCRTGTKREEAIKKLKNGGTFAPMTASTEPSEPSEKKIESDSGTTTETQPAETKKTTPILPKPTTNKTHVVNTKGSKLALRESPAKTKVSESAAKDTDKKGKLIEMLPNGEGFTVLDPGVGYKCEWHHVKTHYGEGFVYNKFVKEIEDSTASYLEYDCANPVNTIFNLSPDWTAKEPNKPYQDKAVGKWCVAYETEHTSTGGSDLESRMLAARTPAAKIILSELGKEDTDEYVATVVSAEAAIRAEDYYVSPQQNENMRILVTLPIKYVSKLKGKTPVIEDPVDSVDDKDREEFSGSVYTEDYKLRDGTTKQTILFMDPANSYKDRVRRVAEFMRAYAVKVDNFDGEVKNLDFRKEADRFEKFIQAFDTLLSANGVPTSGQHSIELGLDQEYIPIYASENSQHHYRVLTAGWNSFVDSEPADSQRSVRYLTYLWDMEEAGRQNMDWIEFVGRFTDYEIVEIRPSAPSGQSAADISSMGNEDNPSSSGLLAADKLDKEINSKDSSDEPICMDLTADSIAAGFKAIGSSLKGSADKLKEDMLMAGDSIRSQIRDEALVTVDFVGEPILVDIDGAMAKINELDDVFATVMNKITLADLVGAILACFNLDFKINLDIDLPLPLELGCLSLPKVPSIDFPDKLPTMDIMADLSTEIFNAIVQALTEAFVQMIKDLVESMMALCKDEADDNAVDINDAIEDAANQDAINQDEAARKTDQDKKDVLDAMGLLDGDFNAPLTDEEKRGRLADLANILQDVSLLIPPAELCRLLKGMASQRTLGLVRSLLRKKYPDFAKKLNTKTKIKDFMIMIGRMVTSDFCDTLARSPRTMRGYDNSCVIIDDLGTHEAERLRSKGDNITDDQILEQLERAKERKKQRGKELQDLMNKLANLQAGKENPFQDAMPPLFCGTDENGNPKPGLIQLKHDSIDFMLDTVLDTVFEPIYMAFNRDASSYQSVMITSTNKKTKVKAAYQTDNGEWVWHPEVRRMEAQGITFNFDTGFEKAKDAKDEEIEVEGGIRTTCLTTKTLLEGLEGAGAFITKMDNEGIYYELILPPDPNTRIAIEQLKQQFEGMTGFEDFDLDALTSFMPDWKIRYKNPWQFIDKDFGQRVDDEYILEIFPGDDPRSDLGLRRDVSVEVEESARNFIQGLYPEQASSVFLPAGGDSGSGGDGITGSNSSDSEWTYEGTMTTQVEVDGDIVRVYVYKSPETDCAPIEQNLDSVVEVNDPDYNPDISPSDAYLEALALEGNARCEYILTHMHRPDLWEVLEELWEKAGCWNYAYVNQFDVYKLPPQQAVFGLIARRKWAYALSENGGDANDPETEQYLDNLRKFYSNFVHPQITNDIMSLIAKEIAECKLFDNTDTLDDMNKKTSDDSSKSSAASQDIQASTPILDHVVFSREPDKYERICGVDPHLLSVQEFKKAAKDAFENGGGMCSLIEDAEDDTKVDPLRDAMIKSVVQMTIRAYIIDYFTRGIFAFAQFSLEEDLDDYTIEFMIKKMQEEIKAYNDSYYEKFMGFIMSLVPVGQREEEPEPDVQVDAPVYDGNDATSTPESEYETDTDPEEELNKVLKSLFIHEFATVAVEMRDLFSRDDALKSIDFNNSTDIHTKFLQDWLPVIDLPKDNFDVRFSTTNTAPITFISPENKKLRAVKVAEERTSFGNGSEFDLTNGNLFLEKFYHIKKKESFTGISELIADSGLALGDGEYKEQQLTAVAEIVNNSWNITFGNVDEVYMSVKHMDETMDYFIENIVTPMQNTVDTFSGNPLFKKEILLGDAFDVGGEWADMLWKVENYFSLFVPGLRLVWVPPVTLTAHKGSASTELDMEANTASFSSNGRVDMGDFFGGIEAVLDSPGGNISEVLPALGAKYKSFEVLELFNAYGEEKQRTVATGQWSDWAPDDPDQVSYGDTQTRILYPTPLIETVGASFWEELKKGNLLSISSATVASLEGQTPPTPWESKYNAELSSLKEQMVSSADYAALFKFSIPIDRFLGLMTVYTIMSVSAQPNVESIFAGTKDELRRAFMALLNPSYKAEGTSNSDLARILQNLSNGISTPCFSFSFGGGIGFKGLGMDLILKLAIKTPLLIFKAIVEMIDPNIKIAKLIIDIGKFAGICLPIPAISIGLLPPTVFGFPPLGIGIGPPLTPLGFVYLALGFEIPMGNPFKDSGDDENISDEEAFEVCDERAKEREEKINKLKEKILSRTQ